MLRVVLSGTMPRQFATKVDMIYRNSQAQFVELGELAKQHMVQVIQSSKKKRRTSKNNLENNIDVTVIQGSQGKEVGVFDMQKMDRNAPYWYIINYGGSVASAGGYQFVPGRFQGDTFVKEDSENRGKPLPAGLSAGAVITPMRYIQKTMTFLRPIVKSMFDNKFGVTDMK